jgi:hypothetical protein
MIRRLLTALLLLVPAVWLTAQDTRGALVPDTQVALMNGSAAVQDLTVGEEIWTWTPGEKPMAGKVTGIRRVHSDSYILLSAGKVQLGATDSHRIFVDGGLALLDAVKVGQKIAGWGPSGKVEMTVTDIRIYPASLIAYDLTVEGHRLFLAGGVLVGD